jgi:hypothetical protein
MFLYFRRFFCLIRLESLLKIMSLRLCLFYVFRVPYVSRSENVGFSPGKRMVPLRET